MVIDTSKLTKDWKTSAQGLIGAAIAVILAVMTLPANASRAVIALAALRAIVLRGDQHVQRRARHLCRVSREPARCMPGGPTSSQLT